MGQRLTISVAVDPSAPMTECFVQRGDTLSALARRYDVSVESIKASNGLTSNTIYVGQRLLIPQSLGDPTPTPIPQSEPVRIQFAPGATSATIKGRLINPNRDQYLLQALAGQQMHVELISDGAANFAISGLDDGQPLKRLEDSDTVWSGTQDYLITILTMEFSSTTYTLMIEISPHRVVGTPERIRFATGAISATVAGHTSAIEPRSYLLNARGGQTMAVALTVDNANAYITVLNPSGDNLAGSDGPLHHWTGVLPVNGDYIIEVLNPGTGLANFGLTITIQ